jgi:hypothetical protein
VASQTLARKDFSEALGRTLTESIGLPDDAAAVIGSLLLDDDGAASLSELESVLNRPIGRLGSSMAQLTRLGVIQRGVQRFPGPRQGTLGLRDLACRLAAAYRKGGMGEIEEVHWRRRETSKFYRLGMHLIHSLCPLEALTQFGAELNRDLQSYSLWEASMLALSRLPDAWEVTLPRDARQILRTKPLIVYGNHPSMLTPFLVAAALERDDFGFVAHGYVERLIPEIRKYLFPVEPTYDGSLREGMKHGLSHLLTVALLNRFDEPDVSDPSKASINRASIQDAAEHVVEGGVSVIFPGGGGEGAWFPGLGVMVSEVLKSDRAEDVYLLPIREKNSSNVRLHRSLARRKRGRRGLVRQPICLAVGEPQSLSLSGFTPATSPKQIVDKLRKRYQAMDL